MKKTINTYNAPQPVGPYNQAVQAGAYLFISGQLAINPKDGKLATLDIALQTQQVMDNIKAILEAAGCSLKDVVQTTIYLSSMTDFEGFNREYAKYFPTDAPARATIGAELKAGALIEVSAVAYKE